MKVSVYNAISLDGFISGPEHDTAWVSEADWKSLEQTVKEYDSILLGSTTYELSLKAAELPYGTANHYVFTQSPERYVENNMVHFTNEDPVGFIKDRPEEKVISIGGGSLNATLLKAGVVTDIITTVHPIILGAGTRQFAGIDHTALTKLEKVSEEDIGDGVVKIHCVVKK